MFDEAIKALVVLSLVLFSFAAHVPPAVSAPGNVSIAAAFCGGGPNGDEGPKHGICHACRVAIADLPPPPAFAERCDIALLIAPVQPADIARPAPFDPKRLARAPPVFS